jgi:hypothetical protein
VHDLAGDDLGDREPDNVGGVEVLNDAPHLGCGQPVARRPSGLKARMPQWARLAMSSLAQACSPTNATRSGATVAGSSA